MNLVFDIILAIIVIVYLLSNSMTALVRIIASVFNEKLTEGTKDNFALLLIILIVAYLACLVIMFIVDREKQLAPKSEGVNQEIRKPGFHGNNPEENN